MNRPRISWMCLLALLAASFGVSAQPFPTKPVRIVVPFSTGSVTDLLARSIGSLYSKLPFDPIRDFSGVTRVASVTLVLITPTALPVTTLKEFIALAKAKPGALNYASAGLGSTAYMSAELFKHVAKVDIVHVPYKILADGWSDLFSGRTHFFVFAAPAAVPMVKDGRVRAIAVTTPKRIPALPDVPTVAEAGLPAAEHTAWFGMFVPAGTPKGLVNKLARDISAVVRDPQTRQRFLTQGAEPVGDSSPEAFTKLLRLENVRFARLIKEAGMQLQ